ncbi:MULTISPECIES: ABC transporter ATP-binding protein [Rhizobium/Agrobacterium group]|uniref:Branched-chain amino acid transport system ATP-binding protein n=1 Tax=Rhizobium soli TaxID=424798 RepID=A0A7X0MU47_9HYPH|nr:MULTISPECIES: ABC transporter ATP-binding protein [Rhizobium/Agrobacterium group]MBB6509930.1 branched-chain amino acid transport system ATP-binding protein [Rhizobium soli]MBP2459432.1 branched-chain amino acid transport system ATP-binding protein [Rhizobium sp. PvP014]MBP2531726.1 branched-chain amino acid transport system ATP-binding protein [Rhizobium sp. PvP099]NSY19341.1 ABC transporter ATP-binding protein [Neorhizobium sp. AL 9.2.2]
MASVSLLSTKGLSRHFGGLKAVDNVDFTIREGEIRALIGPNGAGKTTFVSLLAGRIAPSAGSIEFLGKDITNLPAHKRVRDGIAYTFQITSIYPTLTVFDNVALSAQSALRRHPGSKRSDIAEKAQEALDRVGLADRMGEKAGTMAYGHQRLLEVAMGLALEPKLLILDEPTQGLSDSEIESFCRLVKEIATSATVLLIEHNMPVVMQLADTITVLNHGQILAEGSPGDIRANAAVQAAYLGTG